MKQYTQQQQRKRFRRGLIMAFIASAAFSMKAIFVKLAYPYPGVDAIVLLTYRMLFALPFFVWMTHKANQELPPLSRRDQGIVIVLAVLGYYLASYTDFLGLQYISASLERLIYYLYPTMVLLLGWLFFRERIRRMQILGMAVGYIGVLLVFAKEMELAGSDVGLGSALIFISALSYAGYLSLSGKVVHRIGAVRLSGLATIIASLICVLQFVLTRPLSAAIVPWQVIVLSLLNGVLCTVIPITLTMLAIERIGPARVAQIGMVGPMATIALGILLLGEPFNMWLVLGTSLVLAGIYVANKRH